MRFGKRTFISGDNRCVETKEPPTEAIRYRSRVATASELAARDIENLSDKAQPAEERVRRKRSLISGLRISRHSWRATEVKALAQLPRFDAFRCRPSAARRSRRREKLGGVANIPRAEFFSLRPGGAVHR